MNLLEVGKGMGVLDGPLLGLPNTPLFPAALC